MKKIKYIILSASIFLLTSCSEFLDVNPDKSGNATIYHINQLNDLLTSNYISPNLTYNGVWAESINTSDDCDITPYYYKIGGALDDSYKLAAWDKEVFLNPILESGGSWTGSYSRMFTFNTVLEYLDKVEQTTPSDKEMVRGEALFGRAYFHFFALVAFTKYDLNAPGIGYKTSTSPTDIPKRMTVSYTMDKIAEDLKNAEIALQAAGRTTFELKRNFRITLPTLYSFKARFELYRGNYNLALDAANKALAGHSTLKDFKKDPLYEIQSPISVDILDKDGEKTGKKLQYYEMKKILGNDRYMVEYEEFYLPHKTEQIIFSGYNIPISKSLYNLFDHENDERWKRFYNNNYNIVKVPAISKSGFKYVDQQNLEPWEYHTYQRFAVGNRKLYIVGPTTAEMMLIKAECLARSGKTDEAQSILQKLRITRFTTTESANNIGGSIQDVLDERRRELTSIFRWYDLKRLNGKENANITITKHIYSDLTDFNSTIITKTLAPNDPFYALPIPPAQVTLMGWEDN